MAERLSVYLDAGTMMKLHDFHKLLSAVVPGGLSQSKTVAYCIISAWNQEFVDPFRLGGFTDEEREVVAKYAPTALGDEEDER